MATISNTPRPGYVFDVTDNVWYPIGTGSHNHSEIPSTIVDAKGDIITASAADTPARLAVGNDGETLVADSSTSTGLAYIPTFFAGKNAIINGAFNVWQRGTTFNSASNGTYCADRWALGRNGTNTVNVTQQSFTPGTAPVAGYEGQFFMRASIASTGTLDFLQFSQIIEDVRTFAGQTITVSFWAKGSASASGIVYIEQQFGSGGSATVQTGYPSYTLTTSWQRYSININVPSISGKTVGTSSGFYVAIRSGLTANGSTFDIWGVQVEAGSVATAFQTATGTLQGELAACQYYYQKSYSQSVPPGTATELGRFQSSSGTNNSNWNAYSPKLHSTMRTLPTITVYDDAGTAGKITTLDQNSGETDNVTASASYIGTGSFGLFINLSSEAGIACQWVASAEL